MRSWRTGAPDATRRLGRDLAAEVGAAAVVLLVGDLGTGKTVLVQGFAEALGIPAEEVQSPTFTLVREHDGPGGRLVHVDLYRLEPADLPSLGLEELIDESSFAAVEWAERLPWAVDADLILGLRRTRTTGEREICELPGLDPA